MTVQLGRGIHASSIWRRGGIAFVLGAVLAGLLLAVAPQAHADTLGYPWPSAKCEWTGSATGSCSNYDWYWDENGDGHFTGNNCDGTAGTASGECFDQWGYEYRNCTSYVAWRLSLNGYTMPSIGNANQWDDYFRGKVPVNSTPAIGAIAQRTRAASDTWPTSSRIRALA